MADEFRESPMFQTIEPGLKSIWLWVQGRWALVFKGTRAQCLKKISELRESNKDIDAANLQIRPWTDS